jgi:predicted AlkP superfamily pyrophosphatase or phosphodiesterase
MFRFALLLVLVLPIVHAEEAWAGWRGKARHVIVVVIDGPRWSETWGDPTYAHIPVMARVLVPQGALYTDFRNTGWTYTNCGHTALTTGFYEPIDNNGNQLPANPSFFQRFRAAADQPAESCWVICSKDKLNILGDTADAQWKGRLTPSVDCGIQGRGPKGGYRNDADTIAVVEQVLGQHHPALMLINLRQPDSSGHGKDWPGYLKAIEDCDRMVGQLWRAIQADDQMRDSTDLFVTNDHGRHLDGHLDGFVSHGDDCEGCRHISLLAMGPDIAKGVVIPTKRRQIDLAATVAWLAGVDLPGSPGVVMDELVAPAHRP